MGDRDENGRYANRKTCGARRRPPLQPETYILLYRVGGGEPEVAPGPPETGDLGPWTADGKGVFVNERDNFTIQVFRRDLATGQRTRRA